jgi:hypothetical protein
MEEQRQVRRTRVLKSAKILFDGHASAIDCTVRDLTEKGAGLNVASPLGIPPAFDLSLDGGRTLRPCRVAWWKADRIGVAFGVRVPEVGEHTGSAKARRSGEATDLENCVSIQSGDNRKPI